MFLAAMVLPMGVLAACSSSATPVAPTPSSGTAAPASASSTAASSSIANTWKNPGSVKLTALPVGDNKESTTAAAAGTIFACRAGDPNGPGSRVNGPWIHGDTWDEAAKTVVQGSVSWPTASFSMKEDGGNRVFVTNDLPSGTKTGNFPIASTDPAYKYDSNPNSIKVQSAITITVPITPTASSNPNCTPGTVGILLNGVLLFDGLDATGRDAAAHEEQDACQGHPQDAGQYHYHEVPGCLRDNATGPSTVVGYAYDGYPIVVERDAAGNLPNDADLDVCHGRTSPIQQDGQTVTTYHYDATLEFPYTVGCLHAPSQVKPGP
jgi:YHYH protein